MKSRVLSYNGLKKVGERMIVAIVGAGAAGMAAAIAASEDPKVQVLLLERQSRVGRKLQATGNGRCNLSNQNAIDSGYHGDQKDFWKYAIEQFPPEKTLAWFRRLGLFTVTEQSGRVYPYSDQANSVVDVLRFALERANIQLVTDFEVSKIRKEQDTFILSSRDRTLNADRVIVACGGLAGTKLGGTMSGYKLLRSFGHKCTKLRPALVQLKTSWNGVSALKGVRANCHAAIYHDGQLHSESNGEIQFTDFGLSGPVMFEISRDACAVPGTWECRLDFLPDMDADALQEELIQRKHSARTTDDLLTGVLHNRLGRVLTQAAGVRGRFPLHEMMDSQIHDVCMMVKDFRVELKEPLGMDAAQVTAGGMVTEEFDCMTMQSRLVPGLYACGEVLDVDGDCGGYNLQWAWSSGRLAGVCAGKEET